MNPYVTYYPFAQQYPSYTQPQIDLHTEQYNHRQPSQLRALERRVNQLEQRNNELTRTVNRLDKEVNQLQATVERHTRRLNRLNQRLRTVENRLGVLFSPSEDGF